MVWVVGIGVGLFLLFAFPRQMFGAFAILAVLVGAGFLYWWASSAQEAAIKNSIIVQAKWDPSACSDPKHPIEVIFRNNSRKEITKLWFSLHGYRRGYSDAVSSNSYLYSDKILKAGEAYAGCWAFAQPYGKTISPAALDWQAEISSINHG